MRDLHWYIWSSKRIDFKLAGNVAYVYRCLRGMAPYISNWLIAFNVSPSRRQQPSTTALFFNNAADRSADQTIVTVGDRAFPVAASRLLSRNFRHDSAYFPQPAETHLFARSFHDYNSASDNYLYNYYWPIRFIIFLVTLIIKCN